MAQLRANGITIEYENRGEGEPLLLIMGLGAQLITWPDGFVDELVARGFRAIRYDNRDAGLSTHLDVPPPGIAELVKGLLFRRSVDAPYTLTDLADDAAGVLDGLEIERAHVVGVSMGGMIGQSLAIHHPDRVRSLTSIMSTTGDRRQGRMSVRLLARWLKVRRLIERDPIEGGVALWRLISGPHFDEAATRDLVERSYARDPDPDGVTRQSAAILASPDRTADLERLHLETLVVHGLLDRLVKPSGGVATAKAITGAQLLMFPDMAHDLPEPRWTEMADAIAANAARATEAERVGPR